VTALHDLKSPAYLEWVRRQPCYWGDVACRPSEAHHYPPKGRLGYTDDLSSVPVCHREHRRCHGLVVVFDGKRYQPIPSGEQHIAVLVIFWRFWRTAPMETREQVLRDMGDAREPSVVF
jgi:hypothetical protein